MNEHEDGSKMPRPQVPLTAEEFKDSPFKLIGKMSEKVVRIRGDTTGTAAPVKLPRLLI